MANPNAGAKMEVERQSNVEQQMPVTMMMLARLEEEERQHKAAAEAKEAKRRADILAAKDMANCAEAAEIRRQMAEEEAAKAVGKGGANECSHRSYRIVGVPHEVGKPLPYTVCNYCGAEDVEPGGLPIENVTPEELAMKINLERRPSQMGELHQIAGDYLPQNNAYTFCTDEKHCKRRLSTQLGPLSEDTFRL